MHTDEDKDRIPFLNNSILICVDLCASVADSLPHFFSVPPRLGVSAFHLASRAVRSRTQSRRDEESAEKKNINRR
jgi:hypothetical protein